MNQNSALAHAVAKMIHRSGSTAAGEQQAMLELATLLAACESDGYQVGLAKACARMAINHHGATAAGPAIQYARTLLQGPTPPKPREPLGPLHPPPPRRKLDSSSPTSGEQGATSELRTLLAADDAAAAAQAARTFAAMPAPASAPSPTDHSAFRADLTDVVAAAVQDIARNGPLRGLAAIYAAARGPIGQKK